MSKAEADNKSSKIFSLEEVKNHTREDDCWLVIDGEVFDVTEFLDEHPGGFDIIISNTGTIQSLKIYKRHGALSLHVVACKFAWGTADFGLYLFRKGRFRGIRGDWPQ